MTNLDKVIKILPSDDESSEHLLKILEEIRRLDDNRHKNLAKLLTQMSKLKASSRQDSCPVRDSGILGEWIRHYEGQLAEAQTCLEHSFGVDLEALLRQSGFTLSGNYPELKAGLFTLILDFSTCRVTVWYGPKQERLAGCPMWPETVAARLVKIHRKLGGSLTEESFRRALKESYMSLTEGAYSIALPIVDVIEAFSSLEAGYCLTTGSKRTKSKAAKRSDFSYNLFRFAGPLMRTGLQLQVASLYHTRRRRDFLWVPDSESGDGTVYSHVVWRERNHE